MCCDAVAVFTFSIQKSLNLDFNATVDIIFLLNITFTVYFTNQYKMN